MAQVIVRNLDDEVVTALKTRAKLRGKSLEQELREILTEASRSGSAGKLQLADRIRAMAAGRMVDDSAALIRGDRDAR